MGTNVQARRAHALALEPSGGWLPTGGHFPNAQATTRVSCPFATVKRKNRTGLIGRTNGERYLERTDRRHRRT